jgi:hypothetical protein
LCEIMMRVVQVVSFSSIAGVSFFFFIYVFNNAYN